MGDEVDELRRRHVEQARLTRSRLRCCARHAISAIAAFVVMPMVLSCATPATPPPEAVAPFAPPSIAPPAPEPTPRTNPPTSSATSPAKELPKFDADAAEAAMRALDFDSCITEPGRQFHGYVQRTFSPDGRSPGGRLHLDFSAGGPPDRSMSKCIGDLLRTLRVAAFGGSAMQVRGDFTIKDRTLTWHGPFKVRTEPPPQAD